MNSWYSQTFWLGFTTATVSAALAASSLIIPPRPPHRMAFAGGLFALALEAFCAALSAQSGDAVVALFWQQARFLASALVPGFWIWFSLTYARGNRAEFVRRWRPVLIAAFCLPAVVVAVWGGALIKEVVARAAGTGNTYVLGWGGIVLQGGLLLAAIVVLVNLEQTFRASVGTMRWRIKFVVLAVALTCVVRIYTSSQALMYSSWWSSFDAVNSAAVGLACVLVVWGVTRSGLREVDVYPSRRLIVGSVTILLVGFYLVVVGVLGKVVSSLGGSATFPVQAFIVLGALVALGLLLFSDRLRQRLALFLSRHFRRPMYDHRLVWQTYTERTTSVLEEPEFCRAAASFVSETFRTLSVTIWVLNETQDGLEFGGSTLLSPTGGNSLAKKISAVDGFIPAIMGLEQAEDLDVSREPWARILRECAPGQFQEEGGHRICLPLRSVGRLIGIMTLGDRVSGVPYSLEEHDLMQTISAEVAGGLHNLQLTRRLMLARELEAFQTMSAFFVHDLKNTASTLSLILQNLRKHFDNPEFREDAHRSVAQCVGHINEVISGLTVFRQGLTVKAIPSDLNALVQQTIDELKPSMSVPIRGHLNPLPSILIDEVQIKKVLVNLLLNARDAIGNGEGVVEVGTERDGSWIAMTVKDNGCGMTPEFIQKSLFRPFQTTKKRGLGIGMFHTNMIVEAHHGRIEVESEVGEGTVFRVLLPPEEN